MTARTFKTLDVHERPVLAPARGPFMFSETIPAQEPRLGAGALPARNVSGTMTTDPTYDVLRVAEGIVDLGAELAIVPTITWTFLADGFGLLSVSFDSSPTLLEWGWGGCLGEEIDLTAEPSGSRAFRPFVATARYLQAVWTLRSQRPMRPGPSTIVEVAGQSFDFGAPPVPAGPSYRKAKARFSITGVSSVPP